MTLKERIRGGVIITIALLAIGFVFLGNQRLAYAQEVPNGGDIDNSIFCLLDGNSVTDVFNVSGCGENASTGSLTVIKDVSGGSASASDFEIHVSTDGSDIAGSPQPGSSSGTTYGSLNPDTYVISETGGPANYAPSFQGDCTANGDGTANVSVSANTNSTCTITNTYSAPAPTTGGLVVDKVVDNTGGGTATANDFSFQINGGDAVAFNADGENDISGLAAGPYAVTEVATSTYTSSLGDDCSGDITAGATSTCTITNTYVVPTPPPSCTIVSDTNTEDATDGTPAVLVSPINAAWTAASNPIAFDPSAVWVWSENPAINTTVNTTKDFTRTFDIVGAPVSGSIDIGADNGFVLTVNGHQVVDDSAVENNFSASQHFDISSDLVSGTNTVEADVTNFGVEDSDGTNNPGGLIFQVNLPGNACTTSGGGGGNTSDLSVTKTVNNPTPTEGDQVIYTITVNNAGPDSASGVAVTDLLPDNLTYVSDDSGGTYDPTSGVWTVGTIADEGDAVLHITATVGDTTDTITNTASITADNSTDSNSDNNSGSASINPVAPGGSNVVQTIVVKPSNMQGWAFVNDETNGPGTGMMVFGPATPPLGVGSAELTATSTSDGEILVAAIDQGLPLSEITTLNYSTYQDASNSSDATAIALQFNVAQDVTNLASGWQGRIVYEPYYNNGGTVPLGSWHTWDALNGGNAKWWFSKPADFGGNCPQSSPCTLSSIIALYPNIGINPSPSLGAVVLKAGSGWASFGGDTDALVIGTTEGINATTTTYDFEPDVSDIGVTKTVDNSTPNIGDTVTYTITASDTGDDATGVVVQDILPSTLTFVSTTTADTVGVYDPTTGDWTIGALSSTTPAVLHIMATVNSGQDNGTVITNTADVTAGDTSNVSEDASSSAPVTVTIPAPSNPTPNSGGGGGGGGGGNGPISGSFGSGGGNGPVAPQGQVLGASTSTLTSCDQYLTAFIHYGANNDSSQVTRLQQFLNQFEGDSLTVNGIYDASTLAALEAFQSKYAADVLTPWGENAPTGFVYLTTRREVNEIYCHFTENFPLTPTQQAEISAYRTGHTGGNGAPATTAITPNPTVSGQENENVLPATSTSINPGESQTGAAAEGSPTGGFWSSIGGFFSHLFQH